VKKLYITDTLDLSLIPRENQFLNLTRRSPMPCNDPVKYLTDRLQYDPNLVIESLVFDGNLADLFSVVLRIPVEMRRVKVRLGIDEVALIGQYEGPKLEFGATELPLGAELSWWLL